jgi:hypothetical protein
MLVAPALILEGRATGPALRVIALVINCIVWLDYLALSFC